MRKKETCKVHRRTDAEKRGGERIVRRADGKDSITTTLNQRRRRTRRELSGWDGAGGDDFQQRQWADECGGIEGRESSPRRCKARGGTYLT